MTCAHCGHQIEANHSFCVSCGAPIKKTCPTCQKPLPSDVRFCGYCGFDFSPEAVSKPPRADEPAEVSPKKKRRRFLIPLLLLLFALGAVIYHFTDSTDPGVNPAPKVKVTKPEQPSSMEKLKAKKIIPPDNTDPVDFIVGRWMIQDERLRIRKIGDHLYRADDEAKDLAYEVIWDGKTYALAKKGHHLPFTIEKYDTLRTADGEEYGYRLTPSGERKVRLSPTALFKDIRDLTIAELEKKYKLESVDYDTAKNNPSSDSDFPSFEIGISGLGVTRNYQIKEQGIWLLTVQWIEDETLIERISSGDLDFEDAEYQTELRRLYDQMGQVKTYIWWGPCHAFLSGMPKQMSQQSYNKALLGQEASNLLNGMGNGIYFHNNPSDDKGISVSFAFQDNYDEPSSTPITPDSKVGFLSQENG